jgi:hypothetical protein
VSTETYTITASLWVWTSDKATASWHFLTIDGEAGEAIHALALMRRLENGRRRGWGSMTVSATIGYTNWKTSIFPAQDVHGWLLPVKAAVRKAEGLITGDTAEVTITL